MLLLTINRYNIYKVGCWAVDPHPWPYVGGVSRVCLPVTVSVFEWPIFGSCNDAFPATARWITDRVGSASGSSCRGAYIVCSVAIGLHHLHEMNRRQWKLKLVHSMETVTKKGHFSAILASVTSIQNGFVVHTVEVPYIWNIVQCIYNMYPGYFLCDWIWNMCGATVSQNRDETNEGWL
jgi:hypothetical protein